MRPQDESPRRAATSQEHGRERDPRANRDDGAEGDPGATKRERRPEIPPTPPAKERERAEEEGGAVAEITKDDQEDG